MEFYFCSRIFLCFMCVMILPIFLTGMPISDEETSNKESNQNDGPAKDIEIDTSDSSDENDGPLKSLLREMLNVSNEENYPKTCKCFLLILRNMLIKMVKLVLSKRMKF
ncbi:uncharacterized protein LOC126895006 isoform X2 [Daktulosphaira vitifoliae]|uniref:uncharacterized protein LOC126895006 isoform X2 n=1 Tax=Daktulosphaira vitifoliae TaxID=58002 RepID=UPI0021A98C11|nr:uncharacterized protein LOC126895006 isoform X2 [Daktulosphaira vitifoliae]